MEPWEGGGILLRPKKDFPIFGKGLQELFSTNQRR